MISKGRKFLYNLGNSIWAGIMISISSMIYINCTNKIVGAFLFSLGLLTIMEFKFSLYTGKVGDIKSIKDLPFIITVYVGNIIGCFFTLTVHDTKIPLQIMINKLDCSFIEVFFKSIVCGVIICICVNSYKNVSNNHRFIFTLLGIPSFILCGAEHSIADICYLIASREITTKSLLFILIVTIGNAIGSLCFTLWCSKRKLV